MSIKLFKQLLEIVLNESYNYRSSLSFEIGIPNLANRCITIRKRILSEFTLSFYLVDSVV